MDTWACLTLGKLLALVKRCTSLQYQGFLLRKVESRDTRVYLSEERGENWAKKRWRSRDEVARKPQPQQLAPSLPFQSSKDAAYFKREKESTHTTQKTTGSRGVANVKIESYRTNL